MITMEMVRGIFDDFSESLEHIEMHQTPPSKECLEVVQALSKRYKLYIITARQHKFEEITRRYVEEHFPGMFSGIGLANYYGPGPRFTKSELCKRHGCQLLIDDLKKNIQELEGIAGLLFGKYPWNQEEGLEWNEIQRLLLH